MTKPTGDEGYTLDGDESPEPALFLKEHLYLLPAGRVLDLAMGGGRNALFLARRGYQVDGIDASAAAVSKVRTLAHKEQLNITAQQEDLTHYTIPKNTYKTILNFYFLERSLFPHIKRGLQQGGILLFETYTVEQPRYGKPHNPDYLLQPNELLHSFSDLHIIYYHERVDVREGTPKAIASLIARR